MDDKGVYAVARSVWNNPMFADEEYTQREAWLWLIGAAAWNERSVRGPHRRPVLLQRGEFMFSLRFLEERWGWSKSRVERFLRMLENQDAIRDVNRDGVKVYSICKYNEFQVVGLPKGTKTGTHSETQAGRARDKEEELKTLEEKKEEVAAPKGAPVLQVIVSKPLPVWLNVQAWAGYLEMRRKIRKSPTDHGVDLILKKLDAFRLKGHDPTAILDYSTAGNYTGIFEPRGGKNGQADQRTAHAKHFDATAAVVNDLLADDGQSIESDGGGDAGQARRALLPP